MAEFPFSLTDPQREDLRWNLEDYLQYPIDPAPQIAAHIEQWLVELGDDLFRAVFQANDDAYDLWATLRAKLNDTRIEIITAVAAATAKVAQEGEVTASLGPDFKFAGAEASLAKVEGTIKLKRPAAAITVYGLGESDVNWAFQERGEQLLGRLPDEAAARVSWVLP